MPNEIPTKSTAIKTQALTTAPITNLSSCTTAQRPSYSETIKTTDSNKDDDRNKP